MLKVVPQSSGCFFEVQLSPRARRTCILGLHDGALKVAVQAPPADNAANTALLRFLSDQLGIPHSDVLLAGGHKSKRKRVQILGLDPGAVARKLNLPLQVGSVQVKNRL